MDEDEPEPAIGRPGSLGAHGERGQRCPGGHRPRLQPGPARPAPWHCPRDTGNVQHRTLGRGRRAGFGHRPSLPREPSRCVLAALPRVPLARAPSPSPGAAGMGCHPPGSVRSCGLCCSRQPRGQRGAAAEPRRSRLTARGCSWPRWPRVAAAARGPAVLSAGNKGPFLPREWAQCAQPPAAGLGSAGPRGHGAIQGKGTDLPALNIAFVP